jgi:hypothetical protein
LKLAIEFDVAQPMFSGTADAVVEVLTRLRHCMQGAMLNVTHVAAIDATAHRAMSRLSLTPRFDGPDASPCSGIHTWSRRIQQMVSTLRAVRHLMEGVPAIHTPLDPQAVELAGRQLAVFVGPMAKVLARRAALRCPDVAALYRALAQDIHSLTEREAFLRLQPTKPPTPIHARAPDRPAERSVDLAPSPAGLSLAPEVLEQATRDLTPYLGSISKLLVKRAQAKALDREHLYHLLARQLSSVADRQALLSAAGIHSPLGDIDG